MEKGLEGHGDEGGRWRNGNGMEVKGNEGVRQEKGKKGDGGQGERMEG